MKPQSIRGIAPNERQESLPSFRSLLVPHAALDELFYLHQEALLALDIPQALARLQDYQRALCRHMADEEELLLPLYRERAGPIPGGAPTLFLVEHQKMLQLLTGFQEQLTVLVEAPSDLKRQVLRLLDQESMFKHLVEHHDLREQNILYPTLDQITTAAERRELLSRCFPDAPSGVI
jgi:hemerythrin-like domain-containing protein